MSCIYDIPITGGARNVRTAHASFSSLYMEFPLMKMLQKSLPGSEMLAPQLM